jgi:hypothetical protein
MVGDPSLCEAVKLVELRLGIVLRIVAHINPVKYELLDLVMGKARVQFMDALNGLLKIEPFCVKPDQLALLGVELHVLQQIPEDIVYLYALLALTRTHPLKESVDEGVIREMLSCGCSRHCLPMRSSNRSGPSRPVLWWRGGAYSGISIVPSRRWNTRRLRFPQRSSSRRIRIMSPNVVNES